MDKVRGKFQIEFSLQIASESLIMSVTQSCQSIWLTNPEGSGLLIFKMSLGYPWISHAGSYSEPTLNVLKILSLRTPVMSANLEEYLSSFSSLAFKLQRHPHCPKGITIGPIFSVVEVHQVRHETSWWAGKPHLNVYSQGNSFLHEIYKETN